MLKWHNIIRKEVVIKKREIGKPIVVKQESTWLELIDLEKTNTKTSVILKYYNWTS
jgi:hypothetical protein